MVTIASHPVTVKTPEVELIMEAAASLGFKAIFDPYKPPPVVRWFRGRDFRADVLVKNDNKEVVVVAMSGLVTFAVVNFTHLERKNKDAEALICVSDDVFPIIPKSTWDSAKELDVHLCPLSEVGDVLKGLLD